MEPAREHPDRSTPLSAWDEAEQYGIDMSALSANLDKTVMERIRNHDRALNLALALREARAEQHGQFRKSPGTPD